MFMLHLHGLSVSLVKWAILLFDLWMGILIDKLKAGIMSLNSEFKLRQLS